ncbi:MAG: DUF1971 domain-containing protein [Actinomycetota bacterium]
MATDQDPGEPAPRPPLPAGLVPGRRTPDFTADTVPPALLRDHRTTVWARLEVAAGTVEFADDGGQPVTATPAQAVVIVPGRPHRVTPSADAVFAVQFFVEAAD